MADPLAEILREIALQKREEIERLNRKLQGTDDADLREGLELKLEKLRLELATAERGTVPAPNEEPLDPAQVEDVEPKAPTRAGLEAQVRELQVGLLEAAHAVERGGLNPGTADVAKLREIRDNLHEAMRLIGPAVVAALPPLEGELPASPTPSQQREADTLVRSARVAKMRGQAKEAADLMRRAAEAAPGAAAVQEALGDELVEQNRLAEALNCYAMALRLDPANIGIERKYASVIGRSKGTFDFDTAMRSGKTESMLGSDAACVRAAKWRSVFLPGLGHIVIGQAQRGAAFMGGWLLMVAWASFMLNGLLNTALQRGSNFNALVMLPILAALAIHIASIATLGGGEAAKGPARKVVDRPTPPVNLPFE